MRYALLSGRTALPAALALVLLFLAVGGGQDVGDGPVVKRGRPLLLITADGLVLREAGQEPKRVESLAELVREAPGLQGEFHVSKGEELPVVGDPASDDLVEGRTGRAGKKVVIAAGDIHLLEFARFLADYTGSPVIYDSSRSSFDRTIHLPAPVEGADDDLVKRILQTNGVRVREVRTLGGRHMLILESLQDPASDGEPEKHPIIVVGEESGRILESGTQGDLAGGDAEKGSRVARGPERASLDYFGVHLVPVPEIVRAHIDLEKARGLMVWELDERAGGKVSQVEPLQKFDIITHVDGAAISSSRQFLAALDAVPAGAAFRYRILRKGWLRIVPGRKEE